MRRSSSSLGCRRIPLSARRLRLRESNKVRQKPMTPLCECTHSKRLLLPRNPNPNGRDDYLKKMGPENTKSISPPCKLRSNGKSNTDTVEYRLRQSECRRKRGGVICRIDTKVIRIETHKAFVGTAVDIETSTNTGAAKPFLSITAAGRR
jgi:hypothetical protein